MANKALESVRELLDKAEREGNLYQVWDILSAIRGPDDENRKNKEKFTTKIRQTILTKTQAEKIGVSNYDDFPPTRTDVVELEIHLCSHFFQHIILAGHAINAK